MALPSDLPEWASGGSAVVINPTTAKKAVGFVNSEKPPAGFFNWLFYTINLWLVQLKALFLGTVTVKSLQTDGTGGGAATAAAGDVVASGNVTAGSTVSGNTVSSGSGGGVSAIGATTVGYTRYAQVQTTDATVTTIITLPTLASDTAALVFVEAVGLEVGGANGAGYTSIGQFKNNSGVMTFIGAQVNPSAEEDDAAWGGVAIVGNVNPPLIKVSGKAATTINWTATVRMTIVAG